MEPSTNARGFFRELRRTFFAGIFILIPIVLSMFIVWRVFEWADRAIPQTFGFHWPPFMGLAVILATILIVGLAAKNWFGRKILATGNAVIVSIPLLNKLYLGIKQIVDTVTADKKKLFERVVLMEFPHKGCFVLGFVTSHHNEMFSTIAGNNLLAVFVPNAPNPTTGFLFYAPEEQLTTVGLSVEAAFKMILSAGVIGPDAIREAEKKQSVAEERGGKWSRIFRRKPAMPETPEADQ